MDRPVVEFTPRAARQFKTVLEQDPALGIRIGVRGGGCSGYSYVIDFQKVEPAEDWFRYDQWGVQVYVDPFSGTLLEGTVIDYQDGLDAGFKFDNPNAARHCGCDKSFSVK